MGMKAAEIGVGFHLLVLISMTSTRFWGFDRAAARM
jgi:hypothetical protein